MSDPYEDLACSIEGLREDLSDITRTKPLLSVFPGQTGEHDIFRDLLEELKQLRAEIVELTGAIFSLHPDYRGDE
jgi:hypothetical protein